METRLAAVEGGEPVTCKKPKKTKSRSRRAKAARDNYTKCKRIQSAFAKHKKN